MVITLKFETVATFYISGNTPSSKNGLWQSAAGFTIQSKPTLRWKRNSKQEWRDQREQFMIEAFELDKPLQIWLQFIRNSRRKFDYMNAGQTITDEMQYHGWIENDDSSIIKPFFRDFLYDKDNPGCYIYLVRPLNPEMQ